MNQPAQRTGGLVQPRDAEVVVGGLRLHYLDWGTAGKPPLILLHGLTGNAHNFVWLAPRFVDRYHVLAFDVRGRGDSAPSPDGVYRLESLRDDLQGVVEALGLERISLIGISMGGLISIAYAGAHPDRVVGIALNDVGPDIDPRGLQRIFMSLVGAPSEFDDVTAAARWLRSAAGYLDALSEDDLIAFTRWGLRQTPAGTWVWKLDPAVRDIQLQLKHPSQIDLWGELGRIRCPVLIIRGETSDILSRETVAKMVATLPSAEVVEVPGIGHAPLLNEPVAVAALERFFGVTAGPKAMPLTP
ncbi:MAG TPA: alpha/beta hydrolase [Dehalococcoidia bacterium]|nr:alpha/beta hydrolase [Dehalococcoidia bacterium]